MSTFEANRSIIAINLDAPQIKVSVLLKELKPLEPIHYELLLPLTANQRFDLISNPLWAPILDLKVGDTVWHYKSANAASVAAKARLNGNFGHVYNASSEKNVGFVRYIGPIQEESKSPAGFWIGVELFLDPDRGNSNGKGYFDDANDNSSVFTTINHLYAYDEARDLEQIEQKIGRLEKSVHNLDLHQPKPLRHLAKKDEVMRKFEMDRRNNLDKQDQVLGLQCGKIFENPWSLKQILWLLCHASALYAHFARVLSRIALGSRE